MRISGISGVSRLSIRALSVLACLAMMAGPAHAGDWALYHHDNKRSAVTGERIGTPLHPQWTLDTGHAPSPAWPAPALRDIYNRRPKHVHRVTYDRAYHPVVAGDTLYFASSTDDKVYAVDAKTGKERWAFFTNGPVRCAPTVADGRVYVGSDDGSVYCLDAKTGGQVWRYDAAKDGRILPGNGRLISIAPVRTGVLVDGGVAYFASGLFPREGVHLHALDAGTGAEVWTTDAHGISPQGYLLASKTRLYVPTGRTSPAVFNRKDGSYIGTYSTSGGTYALLTGDAVISGSSRLDMLNAEGRDRIIDFEGRRIVVTEDMYYLLTETQLVAYDRTHLIDARKRQQDLAGRIKTIADSLKAETTRREAAKFNERALYQASIDSLTADLTDLRGTLESIRASEHAWKVPVETAYAMILAGDTLLLGGDDTVTAMSAAKGQTLWEGSVDGRAYGLAAANSRLYVSTDTGEITCFSNMQLSNPATIGPGDAPDDDIDSRYVRAARHVASTVDAKAGYCIVLGCGDGGFIAALARATGLHIVAVDDEPEKVSKVRIYLDAMGLYGSRTAVIEHSLDRLPFTDYVANCIVSADVLDGDALPVDPGEVVRILRPEGGVALFGMPEGAESGTFRDDTRTWLAKIPDISSWNLSDDDGIWLTGSRGPLPGGGEWTHQYAEPGNTASSNDSLVDNEVSVQWFGRPGPRYIVDRHHRPMAPLYKSGRLFVPGSNYLFGLDAYNGTVLWERPLPGSRRVAVFRDTGWMAASSDYLYTAVAGECHTLDTKTGETVRRFPVPATDEPHEWGYIAYHGGELYGTSMKPSAPRRSMDYDTIMEGTYWDNRPLVTGDELFCMDRITGAVKWRYSRGAIIHSTIAMDDRYIYFFESTSPEATADNDGRIQLRFLFEGGGGHLVKLDRMTGETVWDRQIGFPYRHAMFLSLSGGKLLAVGSYNLDDGCYYGLYCYDAETGGDVWNNRFRYTATKNGEHGEQDQHPVIVGDMVYTRPYAFNLNTGEQRAFNLDRGGHGCGTISGSAFWLFGRGGNPRMYPLDGTGAENIPLSLVNRPGCYINMIAVGGLVLIPESSSGCSCGYPIQTSMAFIPRQ